MIGSVRKLLSRRERPAERPEPAEKSGSMLYRDFFSAFGASARTKNLKRESTEIRLPALSRIPEGIIRLDPWEMEFIFALARRAKRGIVEVGRYRGGSTFLLACANRRVPIWSIDIAPMDDSTLTGLLRANGSDQNVHLIVGDSQHRKYDAIDAYDFLFIDGDHSEAGCGADIENWYGALEPGGYMALHDTYLDGEGVQDAVLDFLDRHDDVQIIASPLIGASYWRSPAGSISCFRKIKPKA